MRAFNKGLQLGSMVPNIGETGSAVWTGGWNGCSGESLSPRGAQRVRRERGVWDQPVSASAKPEAQQSQRTSVSVASVTAAPAPQQLMWPSCGSAFMKELRILCSISFQYILVRTPPISKETSGEWAECSASCQLSLWLSSVLPCLSCSPPVPALVWEFIHSQPPQEMIVAFPFRVAVCVTENYEIHTGGIHDDPQKSAEHRL